MALRDEGPQIIATMWTLTPVAMIFVALRAYVRLLIKRPFGIDDLFHSLAFVLLVFYSICITIAAHYGFGQDISRLIQQNSRHLPLALLFEVVGQTFAIVGMVLARWSSAFLLLRLTKPLLTTLRRIILSFMCCLTAASVAACVLSWLQCSLVRYSWWHHVLEICADNPYGLTFFHSLCTLADFLFVGWGWHIQRSVSMKVQDRITTLCGFSLSLITGACGCKRTLEAMQLSSSNYTNDTVGLVLWSAVDITTIEVFNGIVVCLSSCKQLFKMWTSNRIDGQEVRDDHAVQAYGDSSPFPDQNRSPMDAEKWWGTNSLNGKSEVEVLHSARGNLQWGIESQ